MYNLYAYPSYGTVNTSLPPAQQPPPHVVYAQQLPTPLPPISAQLMVNAQPPIAAPPQQIVAAAPSPAPAPPLQYAMPTGQGYQQQQAMTTLMPPPQQPPVQHAPQAQPYNQGFPAPPTFATNKNQIPPQETYRDFPLENLQGVQLPPRQQYGQLEYLSGIWNNGPRQEWGGINSGTSNQTSCQTKTRTGGTVSPRNIKHDLPWAETTENS